MGTSTSHAGGAVVALGNCPHSDAAFDYRTKHWVCTEGLCRLEQGDIQEIIRKRMPHAIPHKALMCAEQLRLFRPSVSLSPAFPRLRSPKKV